MSIDKTNWYCIKFDVPRDTNITAIEFTKSMSEFLTSIDDFNKSIIHGIYDSFTVASYVEDLEVGSIKWWFTDILQKADDKAIDKFVVAPIKITVASILKLVKREVLQLLNDNTIDIKDKKLKIVTSIVTEIENKKADLQPDNLALENKIDDKKLLQSLSKMSSISKKLDGNVEYIDDYKHPDKTIKFSTNFEYENDCKDNENLQNSTEEKIISDNTVEKVLTLITPTSKENCMWEFEDDKKIKCHIKDAEFFRNYQNNQIALRGREMMKVTIRTIQKITTDSKIKHEYFIEKMSVIKNPQQDLFNT